MESYDESGSRIEQRRGINSYTHTAVHGSADVARHKVPGLVSFFSDVPGPCDEVLAQVGDDGVGAHHLGAEDVAKYTLVVVEVDGQQLSLWPGERESESVRATKREGERKGRKCTVNRIFTLSYMYVTQIVGLKKDH